MFNVQVRGPTSLEISPPVDGDCTCQPSPLTSLDFEVWSQFAVTFKYIAYVKCTLS